MCYQINKHIFAEEYYAQYYNDFLYSLTTQFSMHQVSLLTHTTVILVLHTCILNSNSGGFEYGIPVSAYYIQYSLGTV